jgi:predicted PurR-regulated permease PerM
MQLSAPLFDKARQFLNRMRVRFENLPLIKDAIDQMSQVLEDPTTQHKIITAVLKRSGGIVPFTAGILGIVTSIICDLLLTVFFALLFLIKLAEFCRKDESSGRKSEYLIRTVFSGVWLPYADDVTVNEAKRIVSGTLDRLRIWARGYLTLVAVDSTVYTIVLWLLDVPYFPILGLLSGCALLLPYVGPILAASTTVLVTLAVGGASGVQILAIVVAYLIYNGIIEQFILYPVVIGESIGLTTLETIIVVILGAIFAGIPGMILAMPTASVLKYLVPQLYRCWQTRRQS